MMDVREKYVMQKVNRKEKSICPNCIHHNLCIAENNQPCFECNRFIDAHGVTVLPVQVGDTVYGRFRSYGKEVHQCNVVKVKACQFKDRTVRYFLDLEFDIIDPFFRDGRLMRCGMQAIYGADFGDWYRVYLTREEAEATPSEGE